MAFRANRVWLGDGVWIALGCVLFYSTCGGYRRADVPSFRVAGLSTSEGNSRIQTAKDRIAIAPDDFNAYTLLAIGCYQKGSEAYADGLNAVRKAHSLGALDVQLFFYAGVMYDAMGLPDYAAEELSKYLRHFPDDYETVVRLANLHFREHHTDDALALYQKAVALWPKDTTVWFNYAVVLKEKGQTQDAIRYLEQLAAVDGGKLPEGGFYTLGESYTSLSQAAKATEAYQQELNLHPDYLLALEALERDAKVRGDKSAQKTYRQRIQTLKQTKPVAPAQQNG